MKSNDIVYLLTHIPNNLQVLSEGMLDASICVGIFSSIILSILIWQLIETESLSIFHFGTLHFGSGHYQQMVLLGYTVLGNQVLKSSVTQN